MGNRVALRKRPITDCWWPIPARKWRRPAEEVARDLLGRYLVRNISGRRRLTLKIIETEAYLGTPDRASHAFGGRKTPRTATLHLVGGHSYVYLVYGMHHCFNIVAGDESNGEAVLIRAGVPVEGKEVMIASRKLKLPLKPGQLAGGPGKLCQALAIDRSHDAILLDDPAAPLYISRGEPITDPDAIAVGPRIGIDYAKEARDWPLRFAVRGHSEMSVPVLK